MARPIDLGGLVRVFTPNEPLTRNKKVAIASGALATACGIATILLLAAFLNKNADATGKLFNTLAGKKAFIVTGVLTGVLTIGTVTFCCRDKKKAAATKAPLEPI